MEPVPSTAEILLFKMLGRGVDKRWTDWAYEMLNAGFDTENLVILAGELKPYNQFELNTLTDKVFKELDLTWDNHNQVYNNYACYLVSEALDGKKEAVAVLDTLRYIYSSNGYNAPYQSFYEFYYAYDDLKYSEYQSYVAGATRENIDDMIRDYFIKWKADCALAMKDRLV